MAKHTISNAYYSTIIFTTGYGTDNNISIPIRTIYVTKYYYTFTVESNFNLATAHTHTTVHTLPPVAPALRAPRRGRRGLKKKIKAIRRGIAFHHTRGRLFLRASWNITQSRSDLSRWRNDLSTILHFKKAEVKLRAHVWRTASTTLRPADDSEGKICYIVVGEVSWLRLEVLYCLWKSIMCSKYWWRYWEICKSCAFSYVTPKRIKLVVAVIPLYQLRREVIELIISLPSSTTLTGAILDFFYVGTTFIASRSC